jgi:hypothetical protein
VPDGGRGELRAQPTTRRRPGNNRNSPFGPVTTRATTVASRAVPRAPKNHRAATPEGTPKEREERREQPPTRQWPGNDTNSPTRTVTTRTTTVASRAVPRAPKDIRAATRNPAAHPRQGGAPKGREELREQPPTSRWPGNDTNSPTRTVTTRATTVASRAAPPRPYRAPSPVTTPGPALAVRHRSHTTSAPR